MNLERIRERMPFHRNHPGKYSERKRLDAAMDAQRDYPELIYDPRLDKLLYKNPLDIPKEK